MTEEHIKQKADDFIITRQNHIKYFSGEAVKILLKNFAEEIVTEATKELQERLNNAETSNDWYRKSSYGSLYDEISNLKEQIEKIKSDSKTAYIKGIRTMANALKKYDREEGAWTDYFEHTVDKVLKNLLKEQDQ